MTPLPDRDSDLDWLAFRYVAGELTADEAGRFEARLDHDQAAREAVAGAVGLADALAAARPSAVGPARVGGRLRLGPRSRRSAAVLALAACLALAVGPLLWPRAHPRRVEADPATLALTWSGLWQGGGSEPEAGSPGIGAGADRPPAATGDALVAWLDEPGDREPADDKAEGPPAWMLEAAALGTVASPGS